MTSAKELLGRTLRIVDKELKRLEEKTTKLTDKEFARIEEMADLLAALTKAEEKAGAGAGLGFEPTDELKKDLSKQ